MGSGRTRWRHSCFLFLVFLALAGLVRAAAATDGPAVWRRGGAPLKHADIENLARIVGYEGGRGGARDANEPGMVRELAHQAGAAADAVTGRPTAAPPSYSGARNLDVLSIKGDSEFRSHLNQNGLTLLDAIDNRDTGFQAVLVRDARADGRVYAIFRGTEFNVGTNSERWKDAWADVGGVGNNQYAADRAKLDVWANQHAGNLVVTGHSLGGAVGQRFLADHRGAVNEAVFFNSPGVDADVAARVPCGSGPNVSYYVHANDPVSRHGGERHACGRVFMVEGGPTESRNPEGVFFAEHRGSMLQGSTSITEKDFGAWQGERRTVGAAVDVLDRGSKAKDALASDLRGAAGGKTDEQIRKEEVEARQAAYARALSNGTIRLRPGVTGADLMNAIADRGPSAGGLEDLVERIPTANEKAAALAANRCSAPKSQSFWDEGLNRASCRCEGGYRWNSGRTACEPDKEVLVAGKDCSSYGAHAEEYWSDKRGQAWCRCADGFMPDPDGGSCVEASREWLLSRADCSNTPDARPYWDENAGRVRCKSCEPGFRWDGDRPVCVPDREGLVAAKDCSSYGAHAEAYWSEKRGEAWCRCKDGYMPSADKKGCVPATREWLVSRADCSNTPNSRPYWDEKAGKVRCKTCEPGFRWDGDRVACAPDETSRAAPTAPGKTQGERYLKGRGVWSRDPQNKGTMTILIDVEGGKFEGEISGIFNNFFIAGTVKARVEGRYTGGLGEGHLDASGEGLGTVTATPFADVFGALDGRPRSPPPKKPERIPYHLQGTVRGKTVTGYLNAPKHDPKDGKRTTFTVALE